jgi:hypothetical protein
VKINEINSVVILLDIILYFQNSHDLLSLIFMQYSGMTSPGSELIGPNPALSRYCVEHSGAAGVCPSGYEHHHVNNPGYQIIARS